MAKGKFKGMSGGMNMGNMMKQMQKMQKQMEETQAKLEESKVTATAGGGAVEVTCNGKKLVTSIKIDGDLMKDGDHEMLEDMILVAVNDALTQITEQSEREMGKLTGGINIPGL